MYYAYNSKCKDAYSYSYMHVRSLLSEFLYISIISSRVNRFQMKYSAAVACTGSDNRLENLLCGWDVFIMTPVAMTTLNPSKVELK